MGSGTKKRPCLACGYDLRGLGDEPRCPECGLLNIPEGYRRQVWALIDSGKWFFSGPFQFFRKRPPGWWWALDRERDVSRSRRFALRNVAILLTAWSLAFGIVDAVNITFTQRWMVVLPGSRPIEYRTLTRVCGLGGRDVVNYVFRDDQGLYNRIWSNATWFTQTTWTSRVNPSWYGPLVGLWFAVWGVLTWATPAFVGLCTQIRRGLPSFARPPRTIISAANYESHRLLYLAGWGVVGVAAEPFWRVACFTGRSGVDDSVLFALILAGVGFALVGWIGPLRSDYTRQLIRGRLHALRILVMYVLVLPFFISLALGAMPMLALAWWREHYG